MTIDRDLKKDGIADLDNDDWKVRLLAIQDLVRAGLNEVDAIKAGLIHASPFVRQISAKALGSSRYTQASAAATRW